MKITDSMKKAMFPVLALLVFAAGFLLRGCWKNEPAAPAAPAAGPPGAAQIYTCSMHPQVRSPDPKSKCPICAMDLIPVPADGDGQDGDGDLPILRLSPNAAALMEIRTQPVERRAVELDVRLFGKIGLDESRLVVVTARTAGYVENLAANTPWQAVAAGEVLAGFYSPSAVAAMHELLMVRGDAGNRTAARARLLRMGVAAEQLEEILQTGEVPRTFRIDSPAAGALVPPILREGEALRDGDRLARIADLSRVWINLEAYERDLPHLAAGMPVQFTVAAQSGETFDGALVFIDPVLSDPSRTVRLRAEAANPGGRLRPGMFVHARIQAPYAEESLVIPAAAPLITGRRALVYVRDPAADRPTFEARAVVLGPRAGDMYVVEEGLAEGELVVVNGQFKIDSELQIRGRPSMMAAEKPVATGPRPQTHCPVMGGPVNRDLYLDHAGQRIYICCAGCMDELRERADEIIREQRAKGIVFEPSPEAGE